MIALTTTAIAIDEVADQIAAQRRWIDLAEVRIDLLAPRERASVAVLPRLVHARLGDGHGDRTDARLPLIATVRRRDDGGRFEGTEADRLRLLETAAGAGFRYLDLESDLSDDAAHRRILDACDRAGVTVIRSHHDFARVPADLDSLTRGLPRRAGELPKVAVMAESTRDLVRFIEAAGGLGAAPRIALAMGPYGFPSRVLAMRLGSALTFASVPRGDDSGPAAPGHVTPRELVEQYRVPSIGTTTRLFAVIGNPIAHSKSPTYHNARFAVDGIDAALLPILVDDVDDFFRLAELLPLFGASVTIPHKEAVTAHLAEAGDDVRALHACNTLIRVPEGWRGTNTDVIGFLAPLEELDDASLRGRRALVLGAGGAARAIVYALLERGAHVVVWNRTVGRAHALLRSFGETSAAARLAVLDVPAPTRAAMDTLGGGAELIVNTTSVGMGGAGDPAEAYELDGFEIVYDIVYTPPETPLIRRAAEAGCRVITGDRMFAAQAAAQYELYRGLAIADEPDG